MRFLSRGMRGQRPPHGWPSFFTLFVFIFLTKFVAPKSSQKLQHQLPQEVIRSQKKKLMALHLRMGVLTQNGWMDLPVPPHPSPGSAGSRLTTVKHG